MPMLVPIHARLPPALADLLQTRLGDGAIHPALAQGRFFGHWPVPVDQYQQPIKSQKTYLLQRQAANFKVFFARSHDEWDRIRLRQNALIADAELCRTVTTISHVVIGFGIPNPVETNLLLHTLYGIPYLPGTALKGVAQSYLLAGWAEGAGIPILTRTQRAALKADGPLPLASFESLLLNSDKPAEWDAGVAALSAAVERWLTHVAETAGANGGAGGVVIDEAWRQAKRDAIQQWALSPRARRQANAYRAVFGNTDQHGRVIFFDAFPDSVALNVDVLTPHHSKYYSEKGGRRPSDDGEPIPLPFLVLNDGARFLVGVKPLAPADRPVASFALDCLARALADHGIGSKTNSGLGRFAPPTEMER